MLSKKEEEELKTLTKIDRVAVLGGGSWATAIVKILSEKDIKIDWWLRDGESVKCINEKGRNPRYLSHIHVDRSKVKASNDLQSCIKDAQVVVLAVPAAFIIGCLSGFETFSKEQVWISAVKGMIPTYNLLVTDYLFQHKGIPMAHQVVLAGPCHAEEVALEKRSYVTIAGLNQEVNQLIAQLFENRFIKASTLTDLYGVEYCSVMKNIVAIACGLARALNYGDNFQAVLVANAMQEIARFLQSLYPAERDLNGSAYLGDLLVTAYSPHSRNRNLGNLIGKGYSLKAAHMEMNMVAEGYYAVKCIHELNGLDASCTVEMPITKAVYHVLYDRISPMVELKILEDWMV
jgi:glycerol-3-phosphate dehydrogenase (NAD(P)+)